MQDALDRATTRVTDDAFPALPRSTSSSPRDDYDDEAVILSVIKSVEDLVNDVGGIGGDVIWPGYNM